MKTCNFCGRNTPYTDWTSCERCHNVCCRAGAEKTPEQRAERAAWDRMQSRRLRAKWPMLADGHDQSAEAYERLAEDGGLLYVRIWDEVPV